MFIVADLVSLIGMNPHAKELIFLTPVPANKMQRLTYIRGLILELGLELSIAFLSDIQEGHYNNCLFIFLEVFQMTSPPEPYEPRHKISNNVVCATSEASDQPAHTRSLIRAFASRMNIL